MNDKLMVKQAALALIIQDVSTEELSKMLWNLGFSNSRFSRRADVDKAMRMRIAGVLPEGTCAEDIPQEVVDLAHIAARTKSQYTLNTAMTEAAREVRRDFFTAGGKLRRKTLDAVLAHQPRRQP